MKKWEQYLAEKIMKGKQAIEKGRKPKNSYLLALEGKIFVNFAWPAREFQDFIDAFCDEDKKPNEAVWELIAEALEKKSGNS
ncbi:hypothetical protein KAR91_67430 [Candidatus Pacearchaeota archaeon]|nr:hypothetical protein [Candidatus Pacearchaeota archaeon]